jgi:hypothetical protein
VPERPARNRPGEGDARTQAGHRLCVHLVFPRADGKWLDPGRTNCLRVPAPVPAKDFGRSSSTTYGRGRCSQMDNHSRARTLLHPSHRNRTTARLTFTSAPNRLPAKRTTGSAPFPARLVPRLLALRPDGALVRETLKAGRPRTGQLTRSSSNDDNPLARRRAK